VLVVAGSNTVWQEATLQLANLASYVDRGGKLVLHRPTSAFVTAAQPVLFPELDSADATLGMVLRRDVTNAAVRFASHDLYWIDQAGTWNQSETLSTNVATRYYRKRFNLPSYNTIQVENMPIHSTGGASSGGWWLWANGYVAQNITVTQSGTYLFYISAKGTPVANGWPQMSLKIDGKAQDSITEPTNQLSFYTLSADLTAGTHQLAVSFDNDAYAPPEDRNLFLDEIRWGRDADNSASRLLTRPGVVAQINRGAGLVILDEVNWESETKNGTKASRCASTLLTGLGGALRLPAALGVEAETMSNATVAVYSTSGGLARLSSNGRIETPVRVTASGTYTFQVVAGGDAAVGVMPLVGITIDQVTRTNFFLTTTNLTTYTISLFLTAGTHSIGLAFLNDYYAPPEDRNAWFDRLTITPASAFRVSSVSADPTNHLVSLQWEATPGASYEVQFATNLPAAFWQRVVTNYSPGNIASWQDTTAFSAPRRFYRLRQASQ
jgi:hypothetical protein